MRGSSSAKTGKYWEVDESGFSREAEPLGLQLVGESTVCGWRLSGRVSALKKSVCIQTGPLWWLRKERIHLQCNRPGFDLWVGKIPWRREWLLTPQDSCWENPMDRGAWRATVHGITRVGHDLATKPPPPQVKPRKAKALEKKGLLCCLLTRKWLSRRTNEEIIFPQNLSA